ncbi:MAG: hypothetical protein QW818_03400 [Candidatus Aenigmatarchaeota archaeon]|nr:hypothetical protein [Candidatus Aenigmarchaeota archaeon]
MVIQKIFGWGLVLVGLFFIIALPGMGPGRGYMPDEFARVIILIGIIFVGVGIFLLVKS